MLWLPLMTEHLLFALAIGIGLYFARPIVGLLILMATTMAAVLFVGAVVAWNAISFLVQLVVAWFVE